MSASLSFMDAGPFATYEEFVKATIRSKLAEADADLQVAGWRANGIRARLDKFVAEGLFPVIRGMGDWPKALVHADFSMSRTR